MKPLALFTFTCFLLALGARFYAQSTTQKIQQKLISGQQNQREDLFSRPTAQLLDDLKQLDVVIDKSFKEKHQSSAERLKMKELQSLREHFEKEIYLNSDNLASLKSIQDDIRKMAKEIKTKELNTDSFDLFVIFYFIIHENLDFSDINALSSLIDYFTHKEDLERVETYVHSPSFFRDILEFKDIPVSKHNIESFQRGIASLDEGSEDTLFDEYIKNIHGEALNLEAEMFDDMIDEEAVREKLKRINYNDEQISEVIHGHEQYRERY